jgi:hypothetical protein
LEVRFQLGRFRRCFRYRRRLALPPSCTPAVPLTGHALPHLGHPKIGKRPPRHFFL